MSGVRRALSREGRNVAACSDKLTREKETTHTADQRQDIGTDLALCLTLASENPTATKVDVAMIALQDVRSKNAAVQGIDDRRCDCHHRFSRRHLLRALGSLLSVHSRSGQ